MTGIKSKQSILWFVVLFTVLTLMVGTHPSLAQNPKKGGILRCGLAGDIKSLTPFKVGAISARVYANIYDTLLELKPNGKIVPALATSWETVDPTHIRFRLRKGVKFHSGTPFDAETVKWNIEDHLNPKNPGKPASVLRLIKSVTVEDKYTVVIETKYPYAPFTGLATFVQAFSMRDPEMEKKLGRDEFGKRPSGTGPFKFKEWKLHQYVLLERNDDWWGGKPHLDGIKFIFMPEANTRVMALKRGEIDFTYNISAETLKGMMKDPKYKVDLVSSDRMIKLDFNYTREPWKSDQKLRKAISLGIDTEAITEAILGVGGKVAKSLVASSLWGHIPAGFPEYDPKKAKQLLKEAGWVDKNGDGFVEKNGKTLFIDFQFGPVRDTNNTQVAEAIQSQLAEVGVKVKVNPQDWGTFYQGLYKPQIRHDMMILGWGANFDADYIAFNHYYGGYIPPTGQNLARINDPELNKLLEGERSEMDPGARKKLLAQLQRMFFDKTVCIPIYEKTRDAVMQSYVKGYVGHPGGWYPYRFVKTWMDK
jgi:peptide/nickel transport system substrate-binding protein